MNSAKVREVIVTTSPRGVGVESDPCRIVTEFWSPDGAKLAEDDPLSPNNLMGLIRSRADALLSLVDKIAKGDSFIPAELADRAATLRETLQYRT